jgi:hypothetical protein
MMRFLIKVARSLIKFFLSLLLFVLLAMAVLPWGIYYQGLANIIEIPKPLTMMQLSEMQKYAVLDEFKLLHDAQIQQINPYEYVMRMIQPMQSQQNRAVYMQSYVARCIAVDGNLKHRSHFNTQFSTIALTIWLSNHWSQDQIVSRAYACIVHSRKFREHNPWVDKLSGEQNDKK